MSGGSLDYSFKKVNDLAEMVDSLATTNLHFAFASHLRSVAKDLHDLAWVWSGDYGPGDEDAALRAVVTPEAQLGVATTRAETALKQLQNVLDRIK